MLQYLLLGSGLAFAAVVQPGPLQAFLFSRATSEGWRRTLPAALSPLLSDGPIALLVMLVLGRLPATGQQALRIAGGFLLLYLAWTAFRRIASMPDPNQPKSNSTPQTLLAAATVNLLNPNPYLAWALVLGPAAVSAWRQGPVHALVLIVAFYGVMVVGLASFILLVGNARLLPAKTQHALALVSAAILAALGLYQLVVGGRAVAAA
jgi:threonine/homoserine/homoserine lactone efflux protein